MKKILFTAAVALAAGMITTQAQVYSQNIVGYVNVTIPARQFALLSNPLNDGTNTVSSLGAALPNKSTIQVWNGTGFTLASKGGGVWTTNISIPPGTGFFVKSPSAVTNTFVGTVAMGSTNALASQVFALVGSTVPYAGNLTDTNLNIGPTLPNKSTIQVWNGAGFTLSSKGGGVWTTNLNLSVGQGFFVKPASAVNWVQSAP